MRVILFRNTFCHPERMGFPPSQRRDAKDDGSDDDDDDEEEEEEEDEDSEDEEEEGPSSVAARPELTRAERRELKKKQAERANNAGEDGDGVGVGIDGDDLLVNPNHITKKLNISDLSAPRELTRRERYVPVPVSHTSALFLLIFLKISCSQGAEGEERGQGALLEGKYSRLPAG